MVWSTSDALKFRTHIYSQVRRSNYNSGMALTKTWTLEKMLNFSRLLVTAASCSYRSALALSKVFSAPKLAFALLPSPGPYQAGSQRAAAVVSHVRDTGTQLMTSLKFNSSSWKFYCLPWAIVPFCVSLKCIGSKSRNGSVLQPPDFTA